jgi:hypothetical protein
MPPWTLQKIGLLASRTCLISILKAPQCTMHHKVLQFAKYIHLYRLHCFIHRWPWQWPEGEIMFANIRYEICCKGTINMTETWVHLYSAANGECSSCIAVTGSQQDAEPPSGSGDLHKLKSCRNSCCSQSACKVRTNTFPYPRSRTIKWIPRGISML